MDTAAGLVWLVRLTPLNGLGQGRGEGTSSARPIQPAAADASLYSWRAPAQPQLPVLLTAWPPGTLDRRSVASWDAPPASATVQPEGLGTREPGGHGAEVGEGGVRGLIGQTNTDARGPTERKVGGQRGCHSDFPSGQYGQPGLAKLNRKRVHGCAPRGTPPAKVKRIGGSSSSPASSRATFSPALCRRSRLSAFFLAYSRTLCIAKNTFSEL